MTMKQNTTHILILIATFLFITSMTLFFNGPEIILGRLGRIPDIEEKGQIGDAFGGVLSPVIGWVAAVLTFAAFYIQYEANKEQREQFSKQANDTVIERFENRFFELIRIHRENVEEQNIQDIIRGRKVFTTYYFELRYIYFVLEKMHDENLPEQPLTKSELTNLAYLIFFFGIGHVTDNVFSHLSPRYLQQSFFKLTLYRLEKEKKEYRRRINSIRMKNNNQMSLAHIKPELIVEHNDRKAVFIQVYEPFTGHGTKIGHYYRHLFQTVKYVASQEHELFTDRLKYSYVKILRAQLSNFEQVLFYYNSVSSLGRAWIENNYIKDYRLIVNLPLSFTDFGITAEERFKNEASKDEKFFDWYQLKK